MSETIRIMSSNVWGNCPADAPISNRDDNLAVIYHRYLPDAVGMQEVSPKSRGEHPDIIALNADLFAEVPVDCTPFSNNYTPILYRRDRWALGFSGYLNYRGLNDVGSKSVTWAHFTEKVTGARFLLVNTHYYWTNDEAGNEARLSNSGELLALTAELEARYPGVPLFFTGDFNCRTASGPIGLLRNAGLRETRDECPEPPAFCSHHEYPHRTGDCPLFTVPARTSGSSADSIDHIFVKGAAKTERLVYIDDPESLLATDHCPIFADFTL